MLGGCCTYHRYSQIISDHKNVQQPAVHKTSLSYPIFKKKRCAQKMAIDDDPLASEWLGVDGWKPKGCPSPVFESSLGTQI